MSRRLQRVSFVLCIDVEPDERVPPPHGPVSWHGFEAMTACLEKARHRLAESTGQSAAFTWFVRLDPQVEAVCGSADWPAIRFQHEIARLLRSGDDLGLHVHATRFDGRQWTIDHEDDEWVERCIRSSFQAFRRCFSREPAAFRFGDGWMSDRVVAVLEDELVPIDATLRPGWRMPIQPPTDERFLGSVPDYSEVPNHPYQASREDFRHRNPAKPRRLWMMPETTGHLVGSGKQRLMRHLRQLVGRVPARTELPIHPLDMGLSGPAFAAILSQYLHHCPTPLVVGVARSNVASVPALANQLHLNLATLVRRATRDRLVFETATAALERWRSQWGHTASILR